MKIEEGKTYWIDAYYFKGAGKPPYKYRIPALCKQNLSEQSSIFAYIDPINNRVAEKIITHNNIHDTPIFD